MNAAVDVPFLAQQVCAGDPWQDAPVVSRAAGRWLRSMPDFNDPVIRSLPICALAIALAVMEMTASERTAAGDR